VKEPGDESSRGQMSKGAKEPDMLRTVNAGLPYVRNLNESYVAFQDIIILSTDIPISRITNPMSLYRFGHLM